MKYAGGCHCKAVEYEAETEIQTVISCNCSHCSIKGLLLTFVPANQFTLLKGHKNLAGYRFNKKAINHLFCKTCGVQSFSEGKDKEGNPTVAINIRALQDVELDKLPLTQVDGKNW